MAYEADKVVVSLIADNSQFDANVRSSAGAYQKGMTDIETAAGGAEKAHGRMTLAMNNNRIAMLEFQHVARGTADQIAAGAPATQIFAQHLGMLGEAVTLAGGSFGKFGAFLSGPWGLALTVSTALVATLISRHREEADTLDTVYDKLVKHKAQTALSQEADERWTATLPGLIEAQRKLNDELEKRNNLQIVGDKQALVRQQNLVNDLGSQLNAAQLDGAKITPERLKALEDAFHAANQALNQMITAVGSEEGKGLADLSERAKQWAEAQQNVLRNIIGYHPELQALTGQLNGAFQVVNKGVEDAAKAGVNFDSFTKRIDALNQKLLTAPDFVKEYIKQLRDLAGQLEKTAEAAKIDPVKQFEQGVIGAEGTGRNRLGSSAAGIGQFMPSTWEAYFSKLFPDVASGLSKAGIDDMRNNKDAAVAVIDAAAKDYVRVLQAAGQQVSAASLYTVHLLGQRDALKLLNAPAGQSTSDFLSGAVLRGNPFLQGSAGSARAAIARRIGDSSSVVSSASVALTREVDTLMADIDRKYAEGVDKQQEINLLKGGERADVEAIVAGHKTLDDVIRQGILPSLKEWDIEYQQIKDSQQELLNLGDRLIDDVFNPDNWKSWGSAGKAVLRDIEQEFLLLAAINPLKNLLHGPNSPQLPTLNSLFGLFKGSGGPNLFSDPASLLSNVGGITHFADGGLVAGDRNLISVNGQPKGFFSPDEALAVIPNNGRAVSPMSAMPQSLVRFIVESSPYFDGRVMEVSGPVIAQTSVAAANGGATISRRNLQRESMHRLE